MKKKKISGVHRPVETGVWYKSIIEGQSKAEYYRHFIRKVTDLTTEHFGEEETRRVLKGIETKKVKITGIEAFLFDFIDISDPSLELYNTCSSTEEFLVKCLAAFKRRGEMGETDISICLFFLVLSDMLSKDENLSTFFVEKTIYSLLTSLMTISGKSPYIISIIEPKWARKISEQLGLDFKKYSTVLKTIFYTNENLKAATKNCRAFLPPIKVIYPIYEDNRDYQLR